MPLKKKSNIGRNNLKTKGMKIIRKTETPYNRETRLTGNRLRN